MVKGWAKEPQGKIRKGEMNGKLRTSLRTGNYSMIPTWSMVRTHSTYKVENLEFRFSIYQSFQTSRSKAES